MEGENGCCEGGCEQQAGRRGRHGGVSCCDGGHREQVRGDVPL